MTEQPTLLSFAPVEWLSRALALFSATRGGRPIGRTLTSGMLGTCLLVLGVARAEAAPITWHWAGPVTGYACMFGYDCPITLDTSVPLSTQVSVSVTFASDFPTYPNALNPCLMGVASTSLQVLGRTYTSQGYVWEDASGFGGGVCMAGVDWVEIVVPSWGAGGPALPDGWVPFNQSYLPGLYWSGDLTGVQPAFIGSQLPTFYRPFGQDSPQRFTADLQAVPVPEPSTWLLLSTVLSAAGARRVFKRRLR